MYKFKCLRLIESASSFVRLCMVRQRSFNVLAKLLLISHLTASLKMISEQTLPEFDDEIIRHFIFSSSRKLWSDSNTSNSSNNSSQEIDENDHHQSFNSNKDLPLLPFSSFNHPNSLLHQPEVQRKQKFYYLPQDHRYSFANRYGLDSRNYDPYAHHPGPHPPPGYPWDHEDHDDDLEKSFIQYIFPSILVVFTLNQYLLSFEGNF